MKQTLGTVHRTRNFELLNSETVLPDQLIDGEWTGRKIEPRDFLILVQNRKDLFHEIIRACKNLNILIAVPIGCDCYLNWLLKIYQSFLNF